MLSSKKKSHPETDGAAGFGSERLLNGPRLFVLGNPLLGIFNGIRPRETADLNILATLGIPAFDSQETVRYELAIHDRPAAEFSVFTDGGGFSCGFGLTAETAESGSGGGYFGFVFHFLFLVNGLFFGKSSGAEGCLIGQPLVAGVIVAGQTSSLADLRPQTPHNTSGGFLSANPIASIGEPGDFRVGVFAIQFCEQFVFHVHTIT
jgi:hypothetical protein